MANDIERAFAALSDDAAQTPLPTPSFVRRKADRRTATRSIGATVAVGALIAGGFAGARVGLADDPDRPATTNVAAGPSVSPTASAAKPSASGPPVTSAAPPASPKASPKASKPETPTPKASPTRSLPKSIPARAFLQESDMPGRAKDAFTRGAGDSNLPDFCGAEPLGEEDAGTHAAQAMQFEEADAPEGSVPKSAASQDVWVFPGDAAKRYLATMREAVEGCPESQPDGGSKRRNVLLGPIGAGAESALIEVSTAAYGDDGEPVAGGARRNTYYALVRVDDAVTLISNLGWESAGAERDDTVHLARKAADRLTSWRG